MIRAGISLRGDNAFAFDDERLAVVSPLLEPTFYIGEITDPEFHFRRGGRVALGTDANSPFAARGVGVESVAAGWHAALKASIGPFRWNSLVTHSASLRRVGETVSLLFGFLCMSVSKRKRLLTIFQTRG